MSRALAELQRRRAVLQARSRIERQHVVQQAATLLRPMDMAGRAAQATRRLLSRPVWLLGLAAAAVVVRPRRLLAWSGPLMALWRVWRALR